MSDLDLHIQRLIEWAHTQDGCPKNWADIQIIEDPSFSIRSEKWKASKESLMSIKQYEEIFNDLLNKGYSWININFGGIYKNKAIIFIEYPSNPINIPKEKVSINYSGPEGYEWDITEKLCITE